MIQFSTKDINGKTCEFQYEINEDFLPVINFSVYSIPSDCYRFYSHRFEIKDIHTVESQSMDNYKCDEFSKKGIPERIIEIASCYLRRNIISSPLNHQPGEFLIDNSIKVWDRIIQKNPNAEKKGAHYILKFES